MASETPLTNREALQRALTNFDFFTRLGKIRLRAYQKQAAAPILRAVLQREGKTFAVMFPRQSGKNELQAQLECYLLLLFSQKGGEIVKVSPTLRPQCQTAMRRLERTLKANPLTAPLWKKEAGSVYRLGNAAITFLSGAPGSKIVGATASILLEIDEAQDVNPEKYDREIAPMAASTNAVRVFWGTAWTEDTLLAREIRLAESLQTAADQRVFRIDAHTVEREVPAYKQFVAEQVAKFGRDHPLIKSQFFSEMLTGRGSLFTEARIEKMSGSHAFLSEPLPYERYVLLIDVAGSDETSSHLSAAGERDATALTLCRLQPPESECQAVWGYDWQVVQRICWINLPLTEQIERLTSFIRYWNPSQVVVDATGVGAGVAAALLQTFGDGVVLPFVFSAASKSKLGWHFLAMIDAGRWQEAQPNDEPEFAEQISLQQLFYRQLRACQVELVAGPQKGMRWGIKPGVTDPITGQFLHDDLLMSAALAAYLDERIGAGSSGETLIVRRGDPLKSLDKGY